MHDRGHGIVLASVLPSLLQGGLHLRVHLVHLPRDGTRAGLDVLCAADAVATKDGRPAMVGDLNELQHTVSAPSAGVLSERDLRRGVLAAALELGVPSETAADAVPLGAADLAVGILDVRLGHQQLVRRRDVGLLNGSLQGLRVVGVHCRPQGQQRLVVHKHDDLRGIDLLRPGVRPVPAAPRGARPRPQEDLVEGRDDLRDDVLGAQRSATTFALVGQVPLVRRQGGRAAEGLVVVVDQEALQPVAR
mmetsp:Transcript_29523/g.91810  ORF Transcript_29523/g.91810 Transcript_29523/m.91810 type:complete len:248 (-) Transcript_29523:189-932(-)